MSGSLSLSVSTLQQQLEQGEVTSESLTRQALERASDRHGQGHLAFTRLFADQAIELAKLSDAGRRAGRVRSALEGLPVSVKDLFDVKGVTTTAGSKVLANHPPATSHAPLVQRLLDAGGILIGHTNMTEFAFSGLGINPHYGSPSSPWDRETGRISGGSSSGAGVAVADGMSVISLGTDTGGSVRIPAAFCGVTGFKPTARRMKAQGMVPLSHSLDSSGPLGPTVQCCALADAILSGQPLHEHSIPESVAGLRFAVASTVVLDDMDPPIQQAFQQALDTLEAAGAHLTFLPIPEFAQHPYINRRGGLVAAEAWHWHQELVAKQQADYDPRVLTRILLGRDMSASDYLDVVQARRRWIAAVEQRLQWYDALLMPTVPVVAPPITQLQASDDHYFPANAAILRNASLINFLDGCALNIPCHAPGQPPAGLTVAGPALRDAAILAVGQAVQRALQAITS